MSEVVIVIPIYKAIPNAYEVVSFMQFVKTMRHYPISLVTYEKLDISWYVDVLKENQLEYDTVFFEESYFKNVSAYSTLLLSKNFYQTFLKFNYMLIFQLDVYIFKDDLKSWISKGYSYVGAPWISKKEGDFVFDGVGNGGFSLRHVKDHIRAVSSWTDGGLLYLYVRYCFQKGIAPSLFMKRILFRLNKKYYTIFKEHKGNEDIFLGKVVAEKFSWFTVPNFEEALLFSIETEPQYAFEKNNKQLPFGCHAWEKYDLEFWKKWIQL